MTITNYQQALNWVKEGQEISFSNGKLVQLGFLDALTFKYIPSYQADHVSRLVTFFEKQAWGKRTEKNLLHNLSDSFIQRCNSGFSNTKDLIAGYERRLVARGIKSNYLNQSNLVAFSKWQRNALPDKIFHKHPYFYDYLETTGLLSQIKITQDTLIEKSGEPGLLVNGAWTPLSSLKDTFEAVDSPQYGEKFYVHKISRKVYSYLDNGLGLEIHHPYLDGLKPISNLKEKEFQYALIKARAFIRPGDKRLTQKQLESELPKRTYVVQIVSSYIKNKDINVFNLLSRPQHPFLRIIAGADNKNKKIRKGDVFGIGYCRKSRPILPFVSTQGHFRNPDIWEYKGCEERIVTNIAITADEFSKICDYTNKYHLDEVHLGKKLGFHLLQHNCTVYVKNALNAIGIDVPTGINPAQLIALISPDVIQNIGKVCSSITGKSILSLNLIFSFIPNEIRLHIYKLLERINSIIKKVFNSAISLMFVPLRVGIGEAQGEGGAAFSGPEEKECAITPPLRNWKNWFRLSSYTFRLPGILQSWQRQQASTVIYKNPLKISPNLGLTP